VVTQISQLAEIYAAWVAISAIVLWALANWSAKRRLHVSALVLAGVVTLICIALLGYAFTAAGPLPSRTPLQLLLADRAPPLLSSFLLWPFIVTIAVAQLSRQSPTRPPATRWLSFAAGVVLSCIAPFALLMTGCGLAGACF
jgi:hypothetical protein